MYKRQATNIPGSSIKLPNVMDCDALAWYEKQDEALQKRIRMIACFTANLKRVIGDSFSLAPAEAHVTIGSYSTPLLIC